MNPKYQIFISSTYDDLRDERDQVIKSILQMGHIPIGMEMFHAANASQWQIIKRRIEESDYYVVIIAQRYGSIEEESGLSYTEKEYDYATSIGVPTFGFVLDSSAPWPSDKRDKKTKDRKSLEKFIKKVEKKMRASWSNKDNLAKAVSIALINAMATNPKTGWVRADQVANSETVIEITRLSKENAELRESLSHLRKASENMAPVPKLKVDLEVVMGSYDWYELRQTGGMVGSNYVHFGGIGESGAKMVNRDGLWSRLRVSNDGTLATPLEVQITADTPIIAIKDIKAFEEKDSPLSRIAARSSGLESVKYDEPYSNFTFKGNVNMLKPGRHFDFLIPLINSFPEDGSVAEIEVSIFPEIGKHIQQIYKLKDLLPS